MTESECLELAKKHGAGTEREWSSQAKVWFNKPQLTDYTNAAIEQATEIERLKALVIKAQIEMVTMIFEERINSTNFDTLGYYLNETIAERRALLAELTNDFRFCMYCGRPLVEAEGETK